MELRSERLILRPLVLEDAESLLPALRSEDNVRYWSRGPLGSVEEVRDYIRWNVESKDAETFAITRGDDQALGWVVLVERGPKMAELGFILRPDSQGQGLAREAVSRVLEYAFGERELRRVSADVDPDNRASIALLEALAFCYEGRLRATWETHIGVRDSAIYSRLVSD